MSDTIPSGTIEIIEDFHSEILDNDRHVLIYLPPGYEGEWDETYPVLYVNDGQNIFNTNTSFAGVDWGMDETLDRLIEDGLIRKIIVAAIFNTPDRTGEYTHTPDPEEGGGNSEAYASFLINELKPYIDEKYRTLPDASNTGIMGSSFGGLNALYMGWKYSHVFSIVAALSPSLWWADQDIIRLIEGDDREMGPDRIWLDMGSNESEEDESDEDESEDDESDGGEEIEDENSDIDNEDDDVSVEQNEDREDEDEDEVYRDEDEDVDRDEDEDVSDGENEDGEDDRDDDGDGDLDEDEDDEGREDGDEDEDGNDDEDGDEIDESYENILHSRMMGQVFIDKGYELGVDLFYYEDEGAMHNEIYWGNRVDSILMSLFPPVET